jgi:AcrR family transcriptional regulator
LNYHFGSKDAVIDAVFERRIGELNRERIRLLDQVESESDEELTLEAVLEAFLGPAIRLANDPDRGGKVFLRLMGRAHSESDDFFRLKIAKHFGQVFQRFGASFRRLLPGLSTDVLYWRFHFVVGAMAVTMAHKLTLRYLEHFEHAGQEIDSSVMNPEVGVVLNRLVAFAAAGLRAEVPESREIGR